MEYITEADCRHAKKVCKGFEIKHLGEYPDFYVQSNTQLDLLTDTDVLLLVKRGMKGGMCHTIYWYAKAKNKYMRNFLS